MSLLKSATENLASGCRRILVAGPRASGKTTFSISASRFAGDQIRGPKRLCKDVAVIQGDSEGVMGALDAGLDPGPARVLDMTKCPSWRSYLELLDAGLQEMTPLVADGSIRIIVIDLSLPAKLIDRAVPATAEKDWKVVATEGARLYNKFSHLSGVTIIGNAQMKPTVIWGEGTKRGPTEQAVLTAEARSIGGERSAFTIDLPKGVSGLWMDNASFIFMRRVRRTKDGRVYSTITQSSQLYEAKSRCQSHLAPIEDGELSLHNLLKRAYGAAL
jgi:hypothetical protein